MDTFAPAMLKKMKQQPPALIAAYQKVKTKMVEVASAQIEEMANGNLWRSVLAWSNQRRSP
jgi:hypothetical protein